MGNKKPKTIFTDRCQAMANAIEEVFPETRHRLCLWHISRNAAQNLRSMFANPGFKELFNKWLSSRETKLEFESTWNEIIVKFKLEGNTWLKTIYDLREKWCSLFSKDTFSAGILSTQRSESTNNVFNRMATKTMTLTEFVNHYFKQAEQMRSSELEETFRCNNGIPSKAARSSGIKKQAGIVYTRKIYNLFENEFISSLAVKMHEVENNGTLHIFELNEEEHKRVYVIPAQYILKRWTKDAKIGLDGSDGSLQVKDKSTVTLHRNSLMRMACSIINEGAQTESTSKIALQKLTELSELIDKEMKKTKLDDVRKEISEVLNDDLGDNDGNERQILNPSSVWPKGMSNTRKKGLIEMFHQKNASKATDSSKKIKLPSSVDHCSLTKKNSKGSETLILFVGANLNNQQFSTRLPTNNVPTHFPQVYQNPTWTFSQHNFHYPSMFPTYDYRPWLIQQSSSTSQRATHPNLCGSEQQPITRE
ncbi:hypothetical protein M0R45_001938 [Rubus argutus]|uniref:Protein FAR1-RELATED SEQUENCE n=1 Tax=Rubus argutus TaxID=59490 RepID=A0AAW1VIL0_RUBAR